MHDDRITEANHGEIFTEEGQRRSRERIHWLVENAGGQTVLDVGCSQGITTILLGRRGYICLGIDTAAPQIEYARRELEKEDEWTRERVRFEVMDGRELRSGLHDTIILGQVLEHDPDPKSLVEALGALLSPDGRMLITAPYGLQTTRTQQHRSLFFQDLFDLLSTSLNVNELRLLNRHLVAVASRQTSERDFVFDRRCVVAVEEVLGEVQQELFEVKGRLEANTDDGLDVKKRLEAKADEVRLVKEKLQASREEVRLVKEKLRARGHDVQVVMEKLGAKTDEVRDLKEKLRAKAAEVPQPKMKRPPAGLRRKGFVRRLAARIKRRDFNPGTRS